MMVYFKVTYLVTNWQNPKKRIPS